MPDIAAAGSVAVLACALSASAGSGPALTLYVSPDGNDRWSGRLQRPNRDHNDGPLASLAGARDALRRTRAE